MNVYIETIKRLENKILSAKFLDFVIFTVPLNIDSSVASFGVDNFGEQIVAITLL
jgi:hypothetical protein